MWSEERKAWEQEMEIRRSKIREYLKQQISYKPGKVNKWGKLPLMAYHDVRDIEWALDVYTDGNWCSEMRPEVVNGVLICVCRVTVPAPPGSPFPFLFHEDIGMNDNKTKNAETQAMTAKGTGSDSLKRAAFGVDASIRISYEFPRLYMQCKKDGNDWEEPTTKEIEAFYLGELRKDARLRATYPEAEKTTTSTGTTRAATTTVTVAAPAVVTTPTQAVPAGEGKKEGEGESEKKKKVTSLNFWGEVSAYCIEKKIPLADMRTKINAFKGTAEGKSLGPEELVKKFLV